MGVGPDSGADVLTTASVVLASTDHLLVLDNCDRVTKEACEVVTRLLFPVMILVSLYLLIAGHNLPGGGFAGGLVAGTALLIRYLAGGGQELNEALPVPAGALLGGGLVLSVLTAVFPLAFSLTAFMMWTSKSAFYIWYRL